MLKDFAGFVLVVIISSALPLPPEAGSGLVMFMKFRFAAFLATLGMCICMFATVIFFSWLLPYPRLEPYGQAVSNRKASTFPSDSLSSIATCVVCLRNFITVRCEPCNHASLCTSCFQGLPADTAQRCLVCKERITSYHAIYIASKDAPPL